MHGRYKLNVTQIVLNSSGITLLFFIRVRCLIVNSRLVLYFLSALCLLQTIMLTNVKYRKTAAALILHRMEGPPVFVEYISYSSVLVMASLMIMR